MPAKLINSAGSKINSSSGSGSPELTTVSYGTVVTLVQRTDALVRGLNLILHHHGASSEVKADLDSQMHACLDSSDCEAVWLKRCKYALNYPLAKYLKCELPSSPDLPFRPTGCLRRWMKARFNAFNQRNTHFWYSWFQAKRSTLPVSDDIVDETYDKHLATLTRVDPGDSGIIHELFRCTDFIKVLHEVRFDLRDSLTDLSSGSFIEKQPSKSACFQKTRGKGGQQGELLEISGFSENGLSGLELFSMSYRPWIYSKLGNITNYHITLSCPYGINDWENLRQSARSLSSSEPLKCTIQAVLEPNKVRVISKGEALPYYSCKPLQKALHSSLKKMAPFRLIGRPFCPTDMVDLQAMASTTDKWFSIDYSAATDGLSWKYAGAIFRFLIAELPDHQRSIAEQVLGPHALHYPVKGGRGSIELRGVQQNGQLMGSILSFPILCLANLGTYLLATRDHHRDWSFEQRMNHVLINGDDMVYAAPDSLWSRHVEIAGKVGLEMSVGKAYVHREYANINSTSVLLPLHKEGTSRLHPKQINYLNCGLFFGQHKVQARTEVKEEKKETGRIEKYEIARGHFSADREAEGCVANINTLLRGSLPGKEHDLLHQFLEVTKNAFEIKTECTAYDQRWKKFTRNLFTPLSLGGLGVLAPKGWKFRITPSDLRVADSMVRRFVTPFTTQYPLPGWPITKIETVKSCPWSTSSELVLLPSFNCGIKDRKLRPYLGTGFIRYGPYEQVLLA
jgi:hypothetical protein